MKIFLPSPAWGKVTLLRQTSQYSGLTQKATYHVMTGDHDDCDFSVIFEPLPIHKSYRRDKRAKTVLLHMENQDIWKPSVSDLDGIDIVISPYRLNIYSDLNITYRRWYPCVPWFYGVSFSTNSGLLHRPLASAIELDEMKLMPPPTKKKLLSIIVSGKEGTPGHKWRRAIADAINSEFKGAVDLYGFGYNPVADKRHALDPYVYSLVIENSQSDYYITEKIADCLLAWTIPIYSGSIRVGNLLNADIPCIPYGCSPHQAVDMVKKIIRLVHWDFQTLATVRQRAMLELNLFEALPHLLEGI